MLKMGKARNLILVIIVNFMWATQVPVIRLMGDKLGPITIAFIPMIISTLLFIPFLWAENKKRKLAERRTWKDLKYFILPGLIGCFFNAMALYTRFYINIGIQCRYYYVNHPGAGSSLRRYFAERKIKYYTGNRICDCDCRCAVNFFT